MQEQLPQFQAVHRILHMAAQKTVPQFQQFHTCNLRIHISLPLRSFLSTAISTRSIPIFLTGLRSLVSTENHNISLYTAIFIFLHGRIIRSPVPLNPYTGLVLSFTAVFFMNSDLVTLRLPLVTKFILSFVSIPQLYSAAYNKGALPAVKQSRSSSALHVYISGLSTLLRSAAGKCRFPIFSKRNFLFVLNTLRMR